MLCLHLIMIFSYKTLHKDHVGIHRCLEIENCYHDEGDLMCALCYLDYVIFSIIDISSYDLLLSTRSVVSGDVI